MQCEKYAGGSTPTSRRRLRVVVDTGVLVSAFAFGGLPRRAVRYAVQTTNIYVSPELLKEYREVPEELLAEEKVTHLQWQALVIGIASFVSGAKVVRPRRKLEICRDPEDNMLLECCLTARADVLVTGDKDLLEISTQALQSAGLGKLRIQKPSTYVGSVS